ncbi:hypothetical protein Ccrd_022391 [Cynara cardunculus var. scolymus]|uniref:Heme peroxidase n=1 Tax=Cynara cardunculus var. scolymus TaxID=59895 RepID=A0A103XYU5_CYNCS|nr:hypothetical protein Ccrd_022391 [Cynara cardunculus var. scolymus]
MRWHSAGTYDVKSKTGAPFSTMRYKAELGHAANNVLLLFSLTKEEPPVEGHLPDANQGNDHLRNVFVGTMGATYKERSGFEGPQTPNPLIFDNNYFT